MIRRTLGAALVSVALMATFPGAASAHPLGNFTINTSSVITVAPERLRLDYIVDMAEIPAFQELAAIDTDGDGATSEEELDDWASNETARLERGLEVRIDGQAVVLTPVAASATLAPGQGGLSVLRLESRFEAEAPTQGDVAFADGNFPGRIGWREVVATGVDGAAVSSTSVPSVSPSDLLRAYPDDLLSSPPKVLRASFAFAAGTSALPQIAVGSPTSARAEGGGGALAGLVAQGELTLPAVGIALLVAFGLGALHALGPGHGKTLMAAYVVGRNAGSRQAVLVGVAVAAMHTASVLALGVIVFAAERLAPERVYPWLTALSGLTALGLGAALLISRWRSLRVVSDHGHGHEHDHGHDHGHTHDHDHASEGRVLSKRGLVAVAFAGGVLPSPSALLALLASFALGRAALGLAMVATFSLGLACTLIVVAIAVTRARAAVQSRMQGRLTRLVPLASAAVIVAVGATVTVRAVAGM